MSKKLPVGIQVYGLRDLLENTPENFKNVMEQVKALCGDEPIMKVVPYSTYKVGIVTTGNEVFYGRIEDTFTPVVRAKIDAYGSKVTGHRLSNDASENIEKCIREQERLRLNETN
jgi:molybdopterin biosynthesis enzyme